ncbi:MAG: asparagine synthase-related protein [Methanobacterium sp.]
MKCRLRSVYPLGFELSGGMDSSSVVCMAKRILNSELNSSSTKIKTFSFIFDEFKQSDERYYIKKIVKANDIDSIYLKADNISPLSDLNTIFYYQEQPVSSPHIAITWNLYKKIKSNNIRVILCGEGGDSIVSHGDGYFSDLLVNFQFKKLFQEHHFYRN